MWHGEAGESNTIRTIDHDDMDTLPDDIVSVLLTFASGETLRAMRTTSSRVHGLVETHSKTKAARLKDARVGILCDILDRFDVAAAQNIPFRRE